MTFLLLTGLKAEPAIAELNSKAVQQNINNLIKPTPLPDEMGQKAQAFDAQVARANQAVQAERQQEAQEAAQAAAAAITVYGEPADWYKAFIYDHESGNDPHKWNNSGCLGLGQACPASKLLAVCPNEDYGCEDSWFTQYMLSSYGSWQNAYAWWIRTDCRTHGTGKCYPGHWW